MAANTGAKTMPIGFRVTEPLKAEWEQWQILAKEEGLEFRDWLFPRVRQSLRPRPRSVADSLGEAVKRGKRIGLMVGRLDMVFHLGQEENMDPGWVLEWIARHPDCVDDVRLPLLAKSYGVRFDRWWRWLTSAKTGSTAHTPSAPR